MLHEQSNFQKLSQTKKKGLAPLGQLHKEGLVHAPGLHGTEAPRPEHLAIGADSQQAARGYAEDLLLLPWVVDAHGEVADAVGGQGLPRLDVAPLGRVQLKITYGRVRFHNLVIQLKKCD